MLYCKLQGKISLARNLGTYLHCEEIDLRKELEFLRAENATSKRLRLSTCFPNFLHFYRLCVLHGSAFTASPQTVYLHFVKNEIVVSPELRDVRFFERHFVDGVAALALEVCMKVCKGIESNVSFVNEDRKQHEDLLGHNTHRTEPCILHFLTLM